MFFREGDYAVSEEQFDQGKQFSEKNKNVDNMIKLSFVVVLCSIILIGGRETIKPSKGDKFIYKSSHSDSTIANSNKDITESQALVNEISAKLKSKSKQNQEQWNLMLVNKNNEIPDDFTVNLVKLAGGHAVDERVYSDLQHMMNDARAAGLSPYICASYRTHANQVALYNTDVEKYKREGYSEEEAKTKAGNWVAIPGTSEHQLGLAVDIVSSKYQELDKKQENTPEQIWLMENCYKYGFILRYPSNKSDITGIGYEPWHYRYVGKEAAEKITKDRICLEEYLGRD